MKVMKIQLCPFCGFGDIGVKDSLFDGGCYAYCTKCNARGPFVHIDSDTPLHLNDDKVLSMAYEAWNNRGYYDDLSNTK